ncbi:Conserved_hypothetical protein [Hexamita inflata]|uniref:FHA domain-containing protein n=1 Tax=Hexamita inflata TaxID=28002 RepID=A0ABP1IKY0_9EUKA
MFIQTKTWIGSISEKNLTIGRSISEESFIDNQFLYINEKGISGNHLQILIKDNGVIVHFVGSNTTKIVSQTQEQIFLKQEKQQTKSFNNQLMNYNGIDTEEINSKNTAVFVQPRSLDLFLVTKDNQDIYMCSLHFNTSLQQLLQLAMNKKILLTNQLCSKLEQITVLLEKQFQTVLIDENTLKTQTVQFNKIQYPSLQSLQKYIFSNDKMIRLQQTLNTIPKLELFDLNMQKYDRNLTFQAAQIILYDRASVKCLFTGSDVKYCLYVKTSLDISSLPDYKYTCSNISSYLVNQNDLFVFLVYNDTTSLMEYPAMIESDLEPILKIINQNQKNEISEPTKPKPFVQILDLEDSDQIIKPKPKVDKEETESLSEDSDPFQIIAKSKVNMFEPETKCNPFVNKLQQFKLQSQKTSTGIREAVSEYSATNQQEIVQSAVVPPVKAEIKQVQQVQQKVQESNNLQCNNLQVIKQNIIQAEQSEIPKPENQPILIVSRRQQKIQEIETQKAKEMEEAAKQAQISFQSNIVQQPEVITAQKEEVIEIVQYNKVETISKESIVQQKAINTLDTTVLPVIKQEDLSKRAELDYSKILVNGLAVMNGQQVSCSKPFASVNINEQFAFTISLQSQSQPKSLKSTQYQMTKAEFLSGQTK